MKYIIEGGKKLEGKIRIAGNKNSVLPCIAAALLTKEEVVLENVPDISDVGVFIRILKSLGVKVSRLESCLTIKADEITSEILPDDLMIKLRASILFISPILMRKGKVKFYHPGGDIIGRRSVEAHIDGMQKLGVKIRQNDLEYELEFPGRKRPEGNFDIFQIERSVTATENLILTSVLNDGRVTVRNCAIEPHVIDLCKMLLSMGADIDGIGTDKLTIIGKKALHGTKFRVGTDYIEMATYAVAAAITGGKITTEGIDNTDIDPILVPLERFGLEYKRDGNEITFRASELKAIPKLVINVWPGFPTDLMSILIVLATQARGETLCHDWMYESRMFFVDKLISMGAEITIADPHRVVVYGPSNLRARELETPDIRAGMALVLAALVAKGTSYINKAELIERGYENVVGKLSSLGAKIEKE